VCRGTGLSWTAYALIRLCTLLAAMEVAALTWPFLSGQLARGLGAGDQTYALPGGPGMPSHSLRAADAQEVRR